MGKAPRLRSRNVKGDLAHRLALRHVALSSIGKGWDDACLELEQRNAQEWEKTRTVAVIGAGASAPAGLLLADKAAEKLRSRLRVSDEKFNAELEYLRLGIGLECSSTEEHHAPPP